jgi:transposase
MKAYAGIDLHSSNSFIGILDQEDRRLYGKRLPNDLESVLSALEPFKESLDSVVVESTLAGRWAAGGRIQCLFGEPCGNEAIRWPKTH